MLIALQLQNPKLLPPEYADWVLCKTFGCLPSQLDNEDAETVELFLEFYNAEQQDAEIRRKAASK